MTTTTTTTSTIPFSKVNKVAFREPESSSSSSQSTVIMALQQSTTKSSETNALSCTWHNRRQQFLQRILSQYLRFISTPARQEAILKTVQYTLWILSRFYQQRQRRRGDIGTSAAAASLAALSGELSWTRYILRFFGWPACFDGIATGSWGMTGVAALDNDADGKTNDNFSVKLGKALAWTMVVYFPLEHAAYLQWKAPGLQLPSWRWWGRKTSQRGDGDTCRATATNKNYAFQLSAWSCRFWLGFIILDIIKSVRVLQKIQQLEQQDQDGTKDTDEKQAQNETVDTVLVPTRAQTDLVARGQRLKLVRNLLYVLPTIHWSLPKWDSQPWLSDDIVNGLCWVESLVGLYQNVQDFQ